MSKMYTVQDAIADLDQLDAELETYKHSVENSKQIVNAMMSLSSGLEGREDEGYKFKNADCIAEAILSPLREQIDQAMLDGLLEESEVKEILTVDLQSQEVLALLNAVTDSYRALSDSARKPKRSARKLSTFLVKAFVVELDEIAATDSFNVSQLKRWLSARSDAAHKIIMAYDACSHKFSESLVFIENPFRPVAALIDLSKSDRGNTSLYDIETATALVFETLCAQPGTIAAILLNSETAQKSFKKSWGKVRVGAPAIFDQQSAANFGEHLSNLAHIDKEAADKLDAEERRLLEEMRAEDKRRKTEQRQRQEELRMEEERREAEEQRRMRERELRSKAEQEARRKLEDAQAEEEAWRIQKYKEAQEKLETRKAVLRFTLLILALGGMVVGIVYLADKVLDTVFELLGTNVAVTAWGKSVIGGILMVGTIGLFAGDVFGGKVSLFLSTVGAGLIFCALQMHDPFLRTTNTLDNVTIVASWAAMVLGILLAGFGTLMLCEGELNRNGVIFFVFLSGGLFYGGFQFSGISTESVDVLNGVETSDSSIEQPRMDQAHVVLSVLSFQTQDIKTRADS